MRFKSLAILLIGCAFLSTGCLMPRGGWGESGAGSLPSGDSDELFYRRHPQVLTLEQKLDRASTLFYFGEFESSAAAARDLLPTINDLRAASHDPELCDHLDYLEFRTHCLLDRMAMDEIERGSEPHMFALVDSLARSTVIEEEIEVEFNAKTQHWISYFRGSGRKHFSRWLDRAGEFKDVIEPILVEVGVPRDILYLAVIESGLNLNARSYMKAVGPWQFMAGTAKLFGLRMNWWLDERKDIVAATYAAANYLRYLHDLFGSWPLALAAYNSGEHRVARAITRQRTTDYWRLDLPAQTEWFVPKFMAALAIGRNPDRYGFEHPATAPLQFDIVEVERPMELSAIARAAGCSLNELKRLNPHFKKWTTPPDMVVEVKVPWGGGDECRERLAEIKGSHVASYIQHKVKKGETLSSIAAHYELTVKELKKFNEMGKSQIIRAGSILLIPVKDTVRSARVASRPSYRNPAYAPTKVSLPVLSASEGGKKTRYVVRKDDTLVRIAERFHTGLSRIREWNNLTHSSIIRPGDTLTIYLTPDRGRKETADALIDDFAGGGSNSTPAAPGESEDPPSSGPKRITHVVAKGETLSGISRRYGASIAEILSWNPGINRNRLYPGNKITVYVKG